MIGVDRKLIFRLNSVKIKIIFHIEILIKRSFHAKLKHFLLRNVP